MHPRNMEPFNNLTLLLFENIVNKFMMPAISSTVGGSSLCKLDRSAGCAGQRVACYTADDRGLRRL